MFDMVQISNIIQQAFIHACAYTYVDMLSPTLNNFLNLHWLCTYAFFNHGMIWRIKYQHTCKITIICWAVESHKFINTQIWNNS